MRAAFLFLALGTLSACTSTNACKGGTIFLTVSFDAVSAAADSLDVALSQDGGPFEHHPLGHKPNTAQGAIEIDFKGRYPQGSSLVVTVVALQSGSEVGRGTSTIHVGGTCVAARIDVSSPLVMDSAVSGDLSGIDIGATVDAGVDMAQGAFDMSQGGIVDGNALDMAEQIQCSSPADCTHNEAPICDPGTHMCRACVNSGDDAQCSQRTANSVCRPTGSPTLAGLCTQCNSTPDCLALPGPSPNPTPVCNVAAGTCRGCTAHTECTSLVCNLADALTGAAAGTCVDSSDVMYLDNTNGTCSPGVGTHNGNLATPFCDVSSAGAVVSGPANLINRHYMHYAASSAAYLQFSVSPTTANAAGNVFDVTIVGSGDVPAPFPLPSPSPTATSRIFSNDGPALKAVSATSGAVPLNIAIDGVDLVGSSSGTNDSAGFYCDAATSPVSATITNSSIHDSGFQGISGEDGCSITVSQSTVSHNGNGHVGEGILMTSGTLVVLKTVISNNHGAGVSVEEVTSALVSDSTIDNNSLGGIRFGSAASAGALRNEISRSGGYGVWLIGTSAATVDGNLISSSSDTGIEVDNASGFAIVNNVLRANTQLGVKISSTSTGTFQFNTIVGNNPSGTIVAAGISCAGTVSDPVKAIEASIIVNNGTNGTTQIGGTRCLLLSTVASYLNTGTPTLDSYAGAIAGTPVFLSATDLHLKASDSANLTCCINKISGPLDGGTTLSNHDVDNATRPQGGSYDRGADEAQ